MRRDLAACLITVLTLVPSLAVANDAVLAAEALAVEPEPSAIAPDDDAAPSPEAAISPEAELDPARSGGTSASARTLMRPSTRPMFFVGAVGPTFFALNRPRGLDRRVTSRVKLALDFGYHFWKEFEGPAIGATVEQTFDDNFYTFHPGFKFWWDIQVVEDLEISVAPFADAGYMLAAGNGFTEHAFALGAGAEGRVVFEDRWVVLFRPIHVQTLFGDFFDEVFFINYSVLIGGGVAF